MELARVNGSAEDVLTDEMVGRLTEAVGNGLSLFDRFTRGGADRVIGILERLESSGALQKLSETLPNLVERLTRLQAMLAAVESAAQRTSRQPPTRGALGGMWAMMRGPEAQDTLRSLLAAGRELRAAMSTRR